MSHDDLPSAVEAEVSVLSACMISEDVIHDVRTILRDADFRSDAHRKLWRAITAVSDRGDVPDPVTVMDALGSSLDAAGGAEYLADIMDAVPTSARAVQHARAVRDAGTLRRIIEASGRITASAMSPDADALTTLREAEEEILRLSAPSARSEYLPASQAVMEAMEAIEQASKAPDGIVGLRTGFRWLDKIMGGFRDGDLIVLAARPAMGKTSIALQIAETVARSGKGVAFASYEMSRARVMHRRLAARAQIDSHRLRTGNMDEAGYRALSKAAHDLSLIPLYIQNPPQRTVEGLRSDLIRMTRRQDIGLFVVDYLQQMDGTGNNRNAQVEHISRNLKRIAVDLDIPVLALSQLNRGVEKREPPRPQLSDLRDSGAIEQDADAVLMLWRPEEYFDDSTPADQYDKWRDKAELIIPKQRDGETGRLVLSWDGPTTSFREIEHRPEPALSRNGAAPWER